MKPLVRWTIGNVRDVGFEMLRESIRHFKKIYPDFDYFVCCNEIKNKKFPDNINVFLQDHNCCSIPIKPNSINAWKLFPPRLRINSHELFIDNDLIIYKKIPQISEFLKSTRPLCYGTHDDRPFPYGIFSKNFDKTKFKLNSGIFGLPPNYDFEAEIIKNINEANLKKWGVLDEQGLVATCLLNKNPITIHISEISNCWKSYNFGKYGFHFCGHNTEELPVWKYYRKLKIHK